MQHKQLRKSVLNLAMGMCLAAMVPTVVQAQAVTGAVAGRATSGDQIVVTSANTGLTRSVTVGADGSYRLGQLPVGDYMLQVMRDGGAEGEPVAVNVALGGTTTVNLGRQGGIANLGAVTVVGNRVVNRVDVHSTESSVSINREDLARLPVDQSLDSVAMLAPGVVAGNSSFGGLSFGGSSVAENAIFINGLNVTDAFDRQGYSSVPFGFYDQFQIKTGGYSVEFGRSTGGVINAVTRSGSNEFKGGAQITFEPRAGQSSGRDHWHPGTPGDGHPASRDSSQSTKANVWASGPLVEDRLFLFAMYERRDTHGTFTTTPTGSQWNVQSSDDDFWGAKLDWQITDNHLLEVLAFSDKSETGTSEYGYDWDTREVGDFAGNRIANNGGDNWSVTYTGHFTDTFTAKAMIGENNRSDFTRSAADDICDNVNYDSTYSARYAELGDNPKLGCAVNSRIVARDDKREAARVDFEWALGDHLVRFGVDRELMTTDYENFYPGSGTTYTAYVPEPGSEVFGGSGVYIPDDVTQMVRGRRRIEGGVFETEANAFYLEDNWNITPNLLLNLGVRMDRFENRTADGDAFIKQDNLIAPRFGFSWDMKGDGSTKLFGNAGRYYLPVSNNINVAFAGGLVDEYSYYVLDGWTEQTNPLTGSKYLEPVIGTQIGPTDTSMNTGTGDLRQSVDRDLDAVYQDEFILGFQSMINQAWSWGVNATYRKMDRALDDIRINHTPCGPTGSSLWPIGNPGENLTIWGDASIGCETEGWITIDTSRDGYIKGGSGEVTGYSKPERIYKAVEFQIDRAWDDKWAFNASYLWSKLDGNFEGPVNSDTNYGDTGMVQHFDHPAVNERYGRLFNDFRHQFKLRGAYSLNKQWSFGTSVRAQSGGPITAFGVVWPDDTLSAGSFASEGSGGGSGWLCVANCDGTWEERVLEYSPRGAYGDLPWTWNMDANVTWRLPVDGIDLSVRLSVFNLFNNQSAINVHQRYEASPGDTRDTFGTGTRWQSPRYTQLVVTWNF